MYKSALIILFTLITTSCASIQPKELSNENASSLKHKTFTMSEYTPVTFSMITAKNGLINGLIGFNAMNEGDEIVQKNNIEDPSIKLSNKIADELQQKYAMKLSNGPKIQAKSDELEDLINSPEGRNTDYILDVKTIWWGAQYFPKDFNNYQFFYKARIKLINIKKKEVVAQTECHTIVDYKDSNLAPTYGEITNTPILNRESDKTVESCMTLINKIKIL